MDAPEKIHALDDGKDVGKTVNWGLRAELGNHANGVAGLGENSNRAHGQVFGGVSNGFADGLGDGNAAAVGAPARLPEIIHIGFGLEDNAGHDGNSLARIATAGGFRGKHDGIGAVKNCVSDIAGLGAGGPRIFDHGFQHLGGGDDGLSPSSGAPDDMLLEDRDLLGRKLDAQIATRDHDSVGSLQNFFETVHGLGFFEFCDDKYVAAGTRNDLANGAKIGGGTNEGKGDGIHAVLQSEFKVFFVFVGERRNRECDPRQVNAFMLAEQAAVDDFAGDIAAVDGAYTQFDEAIGEQNAGTGLEFLGEIREGCGDQSGIAGKIAGRDGERSAGLDGDGLMTLQASGADLGALQVLQDTQGAAFLECGTAKPDNVAGMVVVGAMREIQTGHVHAHLHQFTHGGFGMAGRTNRADNFCAA